MFNQVQVSDMTPLKSLLTEARSALRTKHKKFTYPSELRSRTCSLETWEQNYKKIDLLNQDILDEISQRAGVYAVFSQSKQKPNLEVMYIGQTAGNGSRQRVRSHLVWRNKDTKSGKSTGSKFDELRSLVAKGYDIYISFVEINPASLRHYVEDELIQKIQPRWNHNGTTLAGQCRVSRM
ncbi:hypothetical protein L4C33_00645 [Vibrio makurazakiensis]|uniref:hypothetical protein n=1 Tax=Vibrio makurazakiensis TaxID=2910250 RepID=UPI003D14B160